MHSTYLTYSLEALATDSYFRDWVLAPTSEAQAFWEEFLALYPEKQELLEEARAVVLGVHEYFDQPQTSKTELQAAFGDLVQEVQRSPNVRPMPVPKTKASPVLKWAVAASVMLVAVLGSLLWLKDYTRVRVYSTDYAEWKTVALPDGSTVWLNANSEVRFQRGWQWGADRKVWLKGEAYFEVEKKPSSGAKFLVQADDITVEVLGTAFNVNTRGENTEVFLEEGKIKLKTDEAQTDVKPGEQVVYSKADKKIVAQNQIDRSSPGSWKDGILILDDQPFSVIIEEIEAIYGVKVEVKDSFLLKQETTIGIPMDELEIAMPILERALEATLTLKEERVLQIE